MRIDRIVVIRDDGRGDLNPTFVVGEGPWRILNEGLDGFDGLDHDLATQDYAQYDGGWLTGERVAAKDRTLTAVAVGDPAALRSEAERFFVSGREYEVHVEASGRRRFCRARHYGFHMATDNARRSQTIEWTFLALDPYWLGEDERRFDVAEAVGAFGFPFMSLESAWKLPTDGSVETEVDCIVEGFVASVLEHEIAMENNGSGTAYPRFDMVASGEVVNPSISIVDSSGSEVCVFGVELTMKAGDELVFDFSSRPTSITLNGENVSNKAVPGSTLASGIAPGDFTLVWSADSGDAALSVRPTIRERFEAI